MTTYLNDSIYIVQWPCFSWAIFYEAPLSGARTSSLYCELNRGATVGYIAPQSFFSFFYYIKSTLVERAKSDKSDST